MLFINNSIIYLFSFITSHSMNVFHIMYFHYYNKMIDTSVSQSLHLDFFLCHANFDASDFLFPNTFLKALCFMYSNDPLAKVRHTFNSRFKEWRNRLCHFMGNVSKSNCKRGMHAGKGNLELFGELQYLYCRHNTLQTQCLFHRNTQ